MKQVNIILFFLLFSHYGYSQLDSLFIKSQKGVLFLSKYAYSENNEYDGEIKDLGFDDFFFPTISFSEKLFTDANLYITFKNGIRIEKLRDRKKIKMNATKVYSFDSSFCYKNDFFYIIPVIIEGKVYNYNFEDCRRNYFELQVLKGCKLRFEYLHKAIKPQRIILTDAVGKAK